MVTNYKITNGDMYLITFRDLSKILEDTYATFYSSTSSTSTKPNVQLVEPYPTTSVKSNSNSISETTITPPIKTSDSKILQNIWIHIFNEKQDPKELKRYDGNKNLWLKDKEHWAATISAAQCDFMLTPDYIYIYKSDT